MKKLTILFGICVCGLCSGMTFSDLIFVNASKSNTYTIDASKLKNARLISTGDNNKLIQQAKVHPNRYLWTYFKTNDGYIDYGNITIKRDDSVVSVINVKVPEHFTNRKLSLDNENWWARFSVNEPMQTVVEHQIRYSSQHYIRIHDYDPNYRYSNQSQVWEYWVMRFDGSEDPEPPANGDPRPQIQALPMEYPLSHDGYKKEEYKGEGGCCLLL